MLESSTIKWALLKWVSPSRSPKNHQYSTDSFVLSLKNWLGQYDLFKLAGRYYLALKNWIQDTNHLGGVYLFLFWTMFDFSLLVNLTPEVASFLFPNLQFSTMARMDRFSRSKIILDQSHLSPYLSRARITSQFNNLLIIEIWQTSSEELIKRRILISL